MPNGRLPPAAAGPRPDPEPARQAKPAPPGDHAPATIESLVRDLDKTISALETHIADMNYAGTDEFDAHTFGRHGFDDGAYEALHELAERVEQVSNDLYSAEEERHSYAALTPQQQTARTHQLEEITQDVRASQTKDAEWARGAQVRETAWTALPPELTAPGRYPDSVKRCGECGGPVETINGIHRCWACFRRSQDGR